jgi:hypothetical protein
MIHLLNVERLNNIEGLNIGRLNGEQLNIE